MVEENRNRLARDLAEAAFERLLDAAGNHWSELVLIGGLVPETLSLSDDAHQGTNDVDVLLDIGMVYDRDESDYGWLEEALTMASFEPQAPNTGWRWIVEIEGFPVRVDFLVDVLDSPDQEIVLPGTGRVTAKNLHGPGPALKDTRRIPWGRREARVASLGGYLVAKGAAVVGRRLDKDLYDFAFVIVHSVRDDKSAAAFAVRGALRSPSDRGRVVDLLAACRQFDHPDAPGSQAYARNAEAAGADDDLELLALDAVTAVRVFKNQIKALFDLS